MCKAYFGRMRGGNHKLNKLLPDTRIVSYALRSVYELPVPKTNTNRYNNSLITFHTLSKHLNMLTYTFNHVLL